MLNRQFLLSKPPTYKDLSLFLVIHISNKLETKHGCKESVLTGEWHPTVG